MRSPDRLLAAPRRRRRRRRARGPSTAPRAGGVTLALAVLAGAVVLYGLVQWLRPAPVLRLDVSAGTVTVPGSPSLPWPTTGEAALAVPGVGLVGSSGGTTPVPVASITKVMTALVVLHDHPLAPGQGGPTITISPADVTLYQQDVATQQSVLAVQAGEQLTELQALEGLLIPSANDMADVLAAWDDGTVAAFVAAMNRKAAALGLHHTHFVSPTGLEAGSVSTPEDLIRLGEAAMADPVLAGVVAMPQATLPVAGTVVNFDDDLTRDGFVGVKTGSDTAAGGCFLFEAEVPVGATTVPVVGAVLGQQATPILQSALDAARSLVAALGPQLAEHLVVATGERIGTVRSAWGASTTLVAAAPLRTITWPGMSVPATVRLDAVGRTLRRGQRVGTLTVVLGGAGHHLPVVASRSVGGPSLGWRLVHP